MKLPAPESLKLDWSPAALESWDRLVYEVKQLGDSAGKGDAFQQMTLRLLQMSRTMDFRRLPELLRKRVAARALTQLWVEDTEFMRRLMNSKLLQSLVAMHRPVLGIVPLQNLITLYFREFDRLDQLGDGMRSELQSVLKDQLELRLGGTKERTVRDVLTVLHDEADWLLRSDGPKQLVEHIRSENMELSDGFIFFELRGLDSGRYGDICRAHYYLETLRHLPVGQYDEVFSELLKPSVCKAPYEGQQRIGHAALEILIDRADGDPGESWQNFIMDMAGDPRIASSAPNFREWWKPIGEDRVEKVRGWLAKEDLRLFLKALEQYGKESRNAELERMFPARKYFLEGLERLKLVKKTRLMLGRKAEFSVKKILGDELKTSYVKLTNDNGMSDKAVIYIDCGDFCIVEGSHSFKLWIYLAPPSEKVYSYDINSLSHSELTHNVPSTYRKTYGWSAPYADITHHPSSWQNKVFEFLTQNGIGIDIENLLSPSDYDRHVKRYGIPVVKNKKRVLLRKGHTKKKEAEKKENNEGAISYKEEFNIKNKADLSELAIGILKYLYPSEVSDVKTMAYVLKTSNNKIINTMHHELSEYCVQDRNFRWRIGTEGIKKMQDRGLIR